VVVGSTAVAEDDALTQYAGNLAFVMNSVNWLAKKESKIGIPPQAPERRELRTTPAAMKMVFLITVLAMPLACILAGGFVWWMRRR
jgi:hypothetical protein